MSNRDYKQPNGDVLISLCQYWGKLRPGQNYKVVEDGQDWVRIRNNGRSLYIPHCIIDPPVPEKVYEEEVEEVQYEYVD